MSRNDSDEDLTRVLDRRVPGVLNAEQRARWQRLNKTCKRSASGQPIERI